MTGDIKCLLCVLLLKKKATSYTAWKDSNSLTNLDSMASIDTSSTDESVGHVLQAYVLPDDMDYSNNYAYLKENNLTYFFLVRPAMVGSINFLLNILVIQEILKRISLKNSCEMILRRSTNK